MPVKKNYDMVRVTRSLARRMTQKAGTDVVNIARSLVRVDNDQLRQSINFRFIKRGDVYIAEVKAGGGDIAHAVPQEYGFRKKPSIKRTTNSPKSGPGGPYTYTPYMRPAAKKVSDNIRKIVDDVINQAIADGRV